MQRKTFIFYSSFLLSFFSIGFKLAAVDYTEITSALINAFAGTEGENEGASAFRSLLIPIGGRAESLGSAYTGLANDVSFIDYNPAASSILPETEISLFHNSWIADSSMESFAGGARLGNLGLGGKVSCFYMPFTEYNNFGKRAAGSYYSETITSFNISYNFFAGHNFRGLAVGANIKASWRAVPDFADGNTGVIIENSGLKQSALGIMGDAGIMMQFDLGKLYISNEANFRVGISAMNLGVVLAGFGKEEIFLDEDPLPTILSAGLSYKIIRPLTFTVDFNQPILFSNTTGYQFFYIGAGIQTEITDFFSILGGFQFKGGSPRMSLGGEFEAFNLRMNINYTLDLTSSTRPVNHISLSAKLILTNNRKKSNRELAEKLYNEGLAFFAQRQYDKAIGRWQEALKVDRTFDPATYAVKNAEVYGEMLKAYEYFNYKP